MASLLPDEWTDNPRQAPRSPSYAGLMQRAAFAEWLQSKRGSMPRKVLAAKVWPKTRDDDATTAQIKRYETVIRDDGGRPTHVTLPSPDTLKRICAVIGVSWLEAFALAGYYGHILQVLAQLTVLANQWLKEDSAEPEFEPAKFYHGVHMLGGVPLWQALQEPQYAQRYTVGCWREGPFQPPPEAYYEGMTPWSAATLKKQHVYEARNEREVCTIVPKPLAVAILVSVTGFPRRGDIYKNGVDVYGAILLSKVARLVEVAEVASGERRVLPPLLRKIDEVLKDKTMALDGRRIIAAEHMARWAAEQCTMYTMFARLAAYGRFGISPGASMNSPARGEAKMPDFHRAQLPDPSEFSSFENS